MTYTAKTLEELLKNASEELGVPVEELDYQITEEKNGVFGIGAAVTAEVTVKSSAPAEEVTVEETVEEAPAEEEKEPAEVNLDDVKEFLFDYLGNYFVGIDQDAEAAIEEKDGALIVNLNSANNAVLIGKMGRTLAAFNTVVRAAVNSQFNTRIEVLVDVNHYKEKRYRTLRSMAHRLGKQVQNTKVDAELDPMPNDERKVIHKALSGWHNLKTQSYGEGPNRHVCIQYVPDEEITEETSAESEEA